MEGREMQNFPNLYIDIPFVSLRFHPHLRAISQGDAHSGHHPLEKDSVQMSFLVCLFAYVGHCP